MPDLKTRKNLKKGDNVAGSVTTFVIRVDGNLIPASLEVLSIEVSKHVNAVSEAKITILDGDQATGGFPVSSADLFLHRAEVVIEAGYDTANTMIFKGIITSQSLRVNTSGQSLLEVECKDRATAMKIGIKKRTFLKKKDSDIISSIIAEYPLLNSYVAPTTTICPMQVQLNSTDWDFILARAEANKMIVTALNGTVSVIKPGAEPTPVVSVMYGDTLLAFDAKWNEWAEAGAAIDEYSKIQGTAKFPGTNLVDPGKFITLAGLGDRFNGDHIISGATHTIAEGYWETQVSIGLPPYKPATVAAVSKGILPVARGLYNGVVKKLSGDPEEEYRILVEVPLLDLFSAGIWARLSNFYATNNAGSFFMPEIGDEVVLGFLNEDPRYPIVLGSVYSSSQRPGNTLALEDRNPLKAIISKSGISLAFDDENKILTIATPGLNTVSISDRDQQITIKDQHANSIVMSGDGIAIKSIKDFIIDADGRINLNSKNKISITALQDVAVTGMNINNTAQMGYTAKGIASAELSASGQVTVKGGMVMIN